MRYPATAARRTEEPDALAVRASIETAALMYMNLRRRILDGSLTRATLESAADERALAAALISEPVTCALMGMDHPAPSDAAAAVQRAARGGHEGVRRLAVRAAEALVELEHGAGAADAD